MGKSRRYAKFFPSPPDNLQYLYDSSSDEGEDDDDIDLGDEVVSSSMELGNIKEGDYVDIISFLSDNGYLVNGAEDRVPIHTLKDKYVAVCCLLLPIMNDSMEASICYAMKSAYSELSARGLNFEIVLVPKMRRLWDKKSVFRHFFSGFSDDVLAVQFSDYKSRDRVCKSVGLSCKNSLVVLIVDPKGKLLQKDNGYLLYSYGSDLYPFTNRHLEALSFSQLLLMLRLDAVHRENHKGLCDTLIDGHEIFGWSPLELKQCLKSPVSVGGLLECDYVTNVAEEKKSVYLSSLGQNLVGVYLCQDGRLMDRLNEVQQQSISLGYKFEIVLVCLAFKDNESSFLDHIKLALGKRSIISWWLFPFNDKISRRLWRLTGYSDGDSLIILPPNKSGELYGKQVIYNFGIDAYPFTRETIVDKKLSDLKSITLKSLLKEFRYLVRIRNGSSERIPISYVRGKKMLIYMDYIDIDTMDLAFCAMLRDLYPQIKAKHPGSDLIFVPLVDFKLSDDQVREMPWLIVPFHSDSVANKLFVNFGESAYSKLVSFGENGEILSRSAEKGLDDDGVDPTHIFDDMLRGELVATLDTISYDEY